jgi:DNA-binding CsgD family transcriptional regulator
MDAIAQARAGDPVGATAIVDAASEQLRAPDLFAGTVQYFFVLAAEAAIRDGWGHPEAWLREAEAFFSAGGFPLVARRCRSLLAEAGAPVPRRGRGDSVVPPPLRALGVTSRELDVLRLVAQGLSNREIADRLVLSPKTVERHLSSLFDRTGVRNRAALAAFAPTEDG